MSFISNLRNKLNTAIINNAVTHPAVVNNQVVRAMPVINLATAPTIERFFKASGTGRLEQNWNAYNASADKELRYNIDVLRARSRDLARNDPYVKKFFRLLKDNVIGKDGFVLSGKFKDSKGAIDSVDIATLEAVWYDWVKKGNCTADRQSGLVATLKDILVAIARDGEVLIRTYAGFNNKHRFAIQVLEADFLATAYNAVLDNGNVVKLGVEQNQFGEPLAYYLYTAHPGDDPLSTYKNSTDLVRVPAAQIIHLYIKDRSSQSRGLPWIIQSMANVKHLNQFVYSEVLASEGAANSWGVITQQPQAVTAYQGDSKDGNQIQMENAPAMIYQLPVGYEYKALNPTHPNIAFNEFVKGVLRGVAAGLGVGYSTLASDRESVNFSSLRQEALEDRDAYKNLQQWLIDDFMTVLYERWLAVAIMSSLPFPEYKIEKYKDVVWRPRSFEWVDPAKDMTAHILALENNLTTRTKILEERGQDFVTLCQELAQEKEIMKKYGLIDSDVNEAMQNGQTAE